jgi:tetratricopeptide (TPR) repeat protein
MSGQDRTQKIALALLLLAATVSIYWQVVRFDFIYYDDGGYVFENHHVLNGWTKDGLKWAFTTQHSRHWHPLTWLSHMTDIQLFGLNPGFHHLASLMFHLANTLLLFLLFNRMTGQRLKSALVAALFALHPLHVETVVWISDRKDLLCTFFWLLTLWAYVFYAGKPAISRYLTVFLFFALALLSKSMAITLPFVLLLMDYWPLERFQLEGPVAQFGSHGEGSILPGIKKMKPGKLLAEKLGFFCLGGTALFVAVLSMYGTSSAKLWMVSTDMDLIVRATVACAIYIHKMFWPFDLVVPYWHMGPIPWWQAAGAAALLMIMTVLALAWAKKRPYLLFGWIWYLLTLSPVIGLVYGTPQKIADRYTYVPLIGLFVVTVWGLEDLLGRFLRHRSVFMASAGSLILALMVISWFQTGHWKNSTTMLKYALTLNPENYLAMGSLGNIFAEQGKLEAATAYYTRAIKTKPDYARAHTNLGAVLRRRGEAQKALEHYLAAVRLDPKDWKAHYNLGNLQAEQGDVDTAVLNYVKALEIKPDHAKAHNNLGVALIRLGRFEEAIDHYSRAVSIDPAFAMGHYNLGRALAETGDVPKQSCITRRRSGSNPITQKRGLTWKFFRSGRQKQITYGIAKR